MHPSLGFNIHKEAERRKEGLSPFIAGSILLGLGISMIPCVLLAAVFKEDISITAIPMFIGLILGTVFLSMYKMPRVVRPVNVLFMLATLWLTAILFGTVPYLLAGLDFFTAFFESTSGYTTTGGSAIADLSVLPQSLLLYRIMTNWIGGMIVIISVMILLPMVGSGSRSVISNEMSGSGTQTMQMKIRDAASQFIQIYIVLTIIMWLILMGLSMEPLEAISVAFSTIATGGFASYSMESYNIIVDFVITFFMFMGATNFYLHFRAIYARKLSFYKKNEEFVWMTFWYLAISVIVFLIVYSNSGATIENFVHSMFMVVSAGTTTGFACADYSSWPATAIIFLFVVALVGGSSGSTAGGIKVSRFVILLKYIHSCVTGILHPQSVRSVTVDKQQISNESVHSALVVISLFIITIVGFSILFMILGLDAIESVTSVVSAITSFGPGVNEFGPMSSFATMDPVFKILMSLLMWLGRLEIAMALAMLLPSVWKEQIKDVKHARRLNNE